MFHSIVADSDQLSMLTKVLNEFCSANGISEAFDRDNVAYRLMQIFGQGAHTEASLMAGLRGEIFVATAA
ncbi:MAG: hypothetical protein AB7P20_10235 [Rhizobiaceae bacterium]